MNTHNTHPTGGHHGEFNSKSGGVPRPSYARTPNARPHDSSKKTFVYNKSGSLASIEAALDKMIASDTPAPVSAAPAGAFHAKKLNARGNKRSARSFEKKFTHTESIPNPRKKKDIIPPLAPGDIRVIPIGGVEKIGGINMTVVEYKDQIVVIDAGIQFSDDDTPGIDYLIPNTKYLEENKHKIKALVITHGHLDHIGSIPFIIEKIGNPPIYTREFGALIIKKRQEEYPSLPELDIKIVEKDDGAIPLSEDLKVRFFGVTHSIPDSTGVAIETPYGDIISTGDIRVENFDGIPTDEEYEQYKFFNDRNVLLMTLDSTGIDKPGWTIAEKVVTDTVDKIIRDTKGRLLIATFASQIERIMKFIESAKRYGRMVVIEGRAMRTNLGIVQHLNLTDLSHVIDVEDMHKYPANKIMMLVTGGQGEQYSILDRVSKGTHKFLKLEPTDTIVFSASIIPGNEKAVDELKDALYRKDPRIITYQDSDVHASGHGTRGELEWVHKQINYKYFMPVHGNYARLKMHRDLVENLGVARERIIVPENNGAIIEFRKQGTEYVILNVSTPHETVSVEGSRIGDVQEVVIRDRNLLSESGVFNVFVVIDEKTGKLRKSPDIFSRGFVYIRENQEMFHKVRGLVKKVVEDATADPKFSIDGIREELIEKVERFLLQKTGKKPIVMAAVVAF